MQTGLGPSGRGRSGSICIRAAATGAAGKELGGGEGRIRGPTRRATATHEGGDAEGGRGKRRRGAGQGGASEGQEGPTTRSKRAGAALGATEAARK